MARIKNIIFDADGTLLQGENPYLFLAEKLGCAQQVKEWVGQYLDGELPYKKLVEKEIDLFKKQYVLNYGSRAHTGDFERMSAPPEIRRGVEKTVKSIIARGIKTYVLSSGFRFIIREVARLQISSDNVHANRFLYDSNGHFITIQIEVTGEKVPAFKEMVKKNGFNIKETAYVGDNDFDRPLIEYMNPFQNSANVDLTNPEV